MTREIEFRGKCSHCDAWAYGSLVDLGEDEAPEIHGFDPYREGDEIWREITVDSDTVGQFTDFLDKNGKKIYEGDILDVTVFDCFDNDRQYRVYVGWIGSEFMGIDVKDSDSAWNLCWLCNQDEEIEVIGNIHDNPELLDAK